MFNLNRNVEIAAFALPLILSTCTKQYIGVQINVPILHHLDAMCTSQEWVASVCMGLVLLNMVANYTILDARSTAISHKITVQNVGGGVPLVPLNPRSKRNVAPVKTKALSERHSTQSVPKSTTTPTSWHQLRTVQRREEMTSPPIKATPTAAAQKTDIVVLVLSRRTSYDTRLAIRETWGTASVRFVVGSCCLVPSSHVLQWTCTRDNTKAAPTAHALRDAEADCAVTDARLAVEHRKFNDVIFAPTVDVYRQLPQKLKAGYEWAVVNSSASWIVKADDDSVIRIDRLDAYLRTSLNAKVPTVYGYVAKGWGVNHAGKWAEHTYKPAKYPLFPLGSHGHVVNRPVAHWIVNNQNDLINYQGEDVSVGIWLDASPFKKSIQWVHSKHSANHGDCFNTGLWMIGHDISAAKMRKCFHATKQTASVYSVDAQHVDTRKAVLSINPVGRLGNLMFEYASAYGIAKQAGASFCPGQQKGGFSFDTLREVFVGPFASDCPRRTENIIKEAGYAVHDASLVSRVQKVAKFVEVAGYLQSSKYFVQVAPKIRKQFEFKPVILKEAQFVLAGLRQDKQRLVGIHVRRGDYIAYGYVNFPPPSYFNNAMAQFPNHQFVVVSMDVDWCKAQPFFANNADVVVLPNDRAGAVDIAILSLCDGIILTLGTFGWWAAWLAKDARVVYYDNVFKLDHPINKRKVRYEDHFLPGWTAVGNNADKNDSSRYLPSTRRCGLINPFTRQVRQNEIERFRKHGWNSVKRFSKPWMFRNGAHIVDIGSYIGSDILAFMAKKPAGTRVDVHTFEPIPSIRTRLIHNVAHFSNVHVSAVGLGSKNRTTCFATSGDATAEVPFSDPRCDAKSEIVDVSHALPQIASRIDLLHINCEGCEAQVLQRLIKTNQMANIDAVEVQFHQNWVLPTTYCAIEAGLKQQGYVLQYRFQYVWELWERPASRRSGETVLQKQPTKRSNPHATFPRDCANPGPLPQGYNVAVPKNGHHNHGSTTLQDLYRIQVCLYATLDAFKTLVNQYNITRWALHAGSLIGAHCYSSINPWDDDVDITVSQQSATAMQSMWNAAEPTTQHYHDTNWDQRYLLSRTFLLYKSRLGEREWYKLVATAQKVKMPSAVGLVGIDIHSNNPAEWAYQRDSGFAAYLNSRQPLHIVEFGPTEANQMPGSIVKRYIHRRDWHCLKNATRPA